MGIGAGVLLFAAGAILSWAVDVNVPYVSDDALGLILMVVGVVAVVAGGLTSSRYEQTGFGTGIMLVVAGAIVVWAVDIDVPYVADDVVGSILLLAGTVAVAVTAVVNARNPQSGIGAGIALTVGGAALVWAVDVDLPYVADFTVGAILLVGGTVALAAGVFAQLRGSKRHGSQQAAYDYARPRYGQPYHGQPHRRG